MRSTANDFSENPLQTRSDLLRAGISLVAPLEQYKSCSHARIKISTATGTGFSEQAAQLEGFARPLWLVPHLFVSSSSSPETRSLLEKSGLTLESWLTGLKNGTDPESPEYWGDLHGFDQRMVEMESIAYSLLVAPDVFRFSEDPVAASNLVKWLRQINDHQMPQNNWRWFRIFVNLALTKTLQVPLEEVNDFIKSDLALLDSFYLGNGWSSDGLWGDDRKQADYYSGSFAIQFAQLLYVRLAPDFDPERTERYKRQAGEFATGFWRYFSRDGAAIPFGRSMTYRFAMGAFWAAAAQADIKLPAPLDQPGAVKGMLLRHLRWWSQKRDMFNLDGTLSIGYTYPNMYISEDYNSPQSVYWCLKSFIAVGMPDDHEFWTVPEAPHPSDLTPRPAGHSLLGEPRQILCNEPEHHFLLSCGQMSKKNHKAREAKYGKFAYSSAFGFSVPIGQLLDQQALDSTLALSMDEGDGWKVHWNPTGVEEGRALISNGRDAEESFVKTLVSEWKPFPGYSDVTIRTTLVPPMKQHPGWHLRVHTLRSTVSNFHQNRSWSQQLLCLDSGFSASAETLNGSCVYEKACIESTDSEALTKDQEGWWKDDQSALVISAAGASGVMDLSKVFRVDEDNAQEWRCGLGGSSRAMIIKPHANTNIMIQRTLIPAIEHSIDLMENVENGELAFTFVTGVFAVEAAAGKSHSEIVQMWQSPPTGTVSQLLQPL